MTVTSHEISLEAWSLLLSQRQDFWNNLPARVPISPNHQWTKEDPSETLSCVDAQDRTRAGMLHLIWRILTCLSIQSSDRA